MLNFRLNNRLLEKRHSPNNLIIRLNPQTKKAVSQTENSLLGTTPNITPPSSLKFPASMEWSFMGVYFERK
jgi:hypothetical protein